MSAEHRWRPIVLCQERFPEPGHIDNRLLPRLVSRTQCIQAEEARGIRYGSYFDPRGAPATVLRFGLQPCFTAGRQFLIDGMLAFGHAT